jgi:hypothetical protein
MLRSVGVLEPDPEEYLEDLATAAIRDASAGSGIWFWGRAPHLPGPGPGPGSRVRCQVAAIANGLLLERWLTSVSSMST